MKHDEQRDLPPRLEEQWRQWATTEPSVDEVQLKRNLRRRIPERKPRHRARLVLVAAAASLLAVMIGIETVRAPSSPGHVDEPALVHELGQNTILILREDGEPIQVVIDQPVGDSGGMR